MNAEKYLAKISRYENQIKYKLEELEELESKLEHKSITLNSKVQTSHNPHKHEEMILYYIEKKENALQEIEELYRKRKKIISLLEQLEDNSHYVVLYELYVNGLIAKEICDKTERSEAWYYKTKKKALEEVQSILDADANIS